MIGIIHPIEIACNPANPVNYLACCGLFDLLARIDPEAHGAWRTEAPTTFWLTTSVTEAELLAIVLDTFSMRHRWHAQRPGPDGEPTWFRVDFEPRDRPAFAVALDCWLETAELDGSIASNSAWKMFAGQQTIESILVLGTKKGRSMIDECASLLKDGPRQTSFARLLEIARPMTSRFGFDPRSSRNALDVGWSPNDLKVPISTALIAEMLALFGVNSFFPSRTARAGWPSSTRGWTSGSKTASTGFSYSLWRRLLPITLARRAASAEETTTPLLFSLRDDSRGKYKNLSLAQTIEAKPPL